MKRPFITVALILVFCLASCFSSTVSSTPRLPSLEPSRTSTLTKAVIAMTPTWAATTTITPVIPPKDVLEYRPLEIYPDLPPGVADNDSLLVYGKPPLIIRLDAGRQSQAVDIGKGYLLLTSPDGKWFSYILPPGDSSTGAWLITESADQKQLNKVTFPDVLLFDSYMWLDNHRLIFPSLTNPNQPALMVVVDPFSGVTINLPANFPDFSRPVGRMAGQMSFIYSDLVYDPSLKLVVYPELLPPKSYVVLWSRSSNSKLAELEEKGIFAHYPLWSLDGQSVAVAVTTSDDHGSVIEEWFRISSTGQIERLTNFGSFFEKAQIGYGVWSPDGKYLAFWLETVPTQCSGVHLSVLEITTKKVIDTCIAGSTDHHLPPVWSPDSRYIAFNNSDIKQTIVINVENWWAAQIPEAKGALPKGWLSIEP